MKKSLLILTLFLSLLGCCKSQDYIAYHPTVQTYEPIKYGALYNWYAATDARNICSVGWHIPTDLEWLTMRTYLGGFNVAGGHVKSTGFDFWDSPNTGADNTSSFNGRGSCYRDSNGSFTQFKLQGFWHSSNNYTTGVASGLALLYNQAVFTRWNGTTGDASKKYGASIRPMRLATTPELSLPDGLISEIYIGNDGKNYRCVKIGTQIWMADNLAETKFRNGDWIHGYDGGTYTPISNASWAALTTNGMCFYLDDPTTYK